MTTIKLKNGSGAPAASDLVQGEPALDLTNKRLYTEDSGGNVIEVGTNPTTLTVDTDTLAVDATNDRVGINTASPANGLHVKDSSSTPAKIESSGSSGSYVLLSDDDSAVYFGNNGASGDAVIWTGSGSDGSGGSEKLRVNSSGNVIVGATSAGNGKVTSVAGVAFEARDGTQPYYQWYNSGAGTDLKYWRCGPNTSGDLQWQTVNDAYDSATVRMVLDSSGNVGIGETDPDSLFHIKGSAVVQTVESSSTGGGSIAFKNGSTTNGFVVGLRGNTTGDGLIYHGDAKNIEFWTSGAQRMTLTSAGKLGLGTNSPSYLLDVAGSGDVRARVRTTGTNSSDDAIFTIQVASTTANSTIEFGDADDRDVGRIIYGHNSNIMRFYIAADEKMRLESDGDLQVEGSVVGSSSVVSDERFKDDVTTITGALDTVDSLRGVTFTWNAGKNTGDTDYGFIAQEVEQVIPEIVHDKKLPLFSGDEDTVYKTVDYARVCAVLVEAVSELRAEVKSLETRLAAVEAN